ncbi:hypothetical protein TrLO_g14219 [Triparma laevis f. longispina]|uniref:Uncharacterized protein n=2 Tax=Triparma laevis TaxID=1534972 RepID=A0A9W7C678_9STRA|nr:hypothetical protein TrLO_g14219 [Triparma laevis f. longispina]
MLHLSHFLLLLTYLTPFANAYLIPTPSSRSHPFRSHRFISSSLRSTEVPTDAASGIVSLPKDGEDMSTDWELDVYSRPVLVDGKKLWEVLITDSTGSLKYCTPLPSSSVNSKLVRQTIESLITHTTSLSLPPPRTIKFFRSQMFNMLNIALSEIDVVSVPSRATYALKTWLNDREKNVYPKMPDYQPSLSAGALSNAGSGFLDISTPVKLPDALRGEKYAFVSLPLSEFLPGGSITEENIGLGRLCPVEEGGVGGDEFVSGVVVMSKRAKGLAAWMAGTEIAGIRCDLRKRNMIMEADISTQYLVARLDEGQRKEGEAFEKQKEEMGGLHFLCVQEDEEDEEPKGFWLLKDMGD